MMILAFLKKYSALLLGLCLIAGTADAWEPRPGWRDSYSVGGICYCDSSNYDHGIGGVKLEASDGYQRSVQQVCADIKTKFGVGALEGRVPYNTIACGNAPANDAPDEDLVTGCPGRVDRGSTGCFDLGPEWPLDELYGAPIEALDRSGWQISASNDLVGTAAMADGDSDTRWSTKVKQAPGQWIEVDLGGLYKANVVDLEAVGSRDDFPVGWTLDVSVDGLTWVVAGNSSDKIERPLQQGEVTRLQFPLSQVRHLRITQTGHSKEYYWSVHEINIGLLTDK